MKLRLHSAVKMLALAAAMAVASSASAQSAGQWTAKFGVGKITPKVESGNVSAPALPNSQADVGADTKPVFGIAYGITDNIVADLHLGVPFEHELYGAGAIEGTGKLGSVKALPPTLLLQYRFFEPKATFRPYAGVGATYAYFADETGSGQLTAITNTGGAPVTFEIKNKLAATIQLGLVYNINERWFADVNATKTFLKTKVTFSTSQTQDMTLDPESVSISVGYKF